MIMQWDIWILKGDVNPADETPMQWTEREIQVLKDAGITSAMVMRHGIWEIPELIDERVSRIEVESQGYTWVLERRKEKIEATERRMNQWQTPGYEG